MSRHTHGLTLRERVLMFFARHPDEELSTSDILDKFGCHDPKIVGKSLMYAASHGVLRKEWSPGGPAMYSAGPALLAEVSPRRAR